MPRSFGLRLGIAMCAAAMLLLAACGDGEPAKAPTITSIQVSPATATIVAGKTQKFTATAKYSDGTTKDLTSATWTSSNTTLATISLDGLLTGKAAGTVTVAASSEGVNGSATATITAAQMTGLSVSPGTLSVPLGRTPQLVANGTFTDNTTKAVTATWTSSDETVATVVNGMLATHKTGTTTITATAGTFTSTANLTVTVSVLDAVEVSPSNWRGKIGETAQLTATAVYSDGMRTDVTATATWSTATTAVVNVLNSEGRQGLTLGAGVGSDSVNATYESVSGAASVEVWAPTARFAYAANEGANAVSIYSVSPETGTLRALGFQQTPASTWWTTVDATGNYLLSADDGMQEGETDALRVYRINPDTGALTYHHEAPGGAAWQIALHQNNRFVYLVNVENVMSYTLDEFGMVTQTGVYLDGSNGLRSLSLDPAGKYLYVADSDGMSIHVFSVDQATGVLTELANSPVALGAQPDFVAVDPLGRFLYTTTGSDVVGFTIDPTTGELSPMDATFSCPSDCSNLAINPDATRMYVTLESETDAIVVYNIDQQTGALTQEGTVASAPVYGYGVALSPDAKYLYYTDESTNVIYGLSLDPTTHLPVEFAANARAVATPSSLAFATGEQPVIYTPTWAALTTTDGMEYGTNFLFAVDPVTGGLSIRNSSPIVVNPTLAKRTRESLESMRAATPTKSKLFGARRAIKRPVVNSRRNRKAVN